MTLTYRKGVTTLAEFRALLARHEAELAEDGPVPVLVDCAHPFDAVGLEWSAHRSVGDRVAVTVRYRCVTCGEVAGSSTKRVKP